MKRLTIYVIAANLILWTLATIVWFTVPASGATQTCTSSTFSGITTTVCSKPKRVCKSSTFAGVTRTVCSK